MAIAPTYDINTSPKRAITLTKIDESKFTNDMRMFISCLSIGPNMKRIRQ